MQEKEIGADIYSLSRLPRIAHVTIVILAYNKVTDHKYKASGEKETKFVNKFNYFNHYYTSFCDPAFNLTLVELSES